MGNLEMKKLFNSIFNNRKVLITGNTGFKGSWLALWLNQMGADVTGFSIDRVGELSHFDLLNIEQKTIFGDVRDFTTVERAINENEPEIIFHLAAQSLVRDSYRNPIFTYETNVMGPLNIFEASRKSKFVKAIVNITTDKVYENYEWERPYNESDRLGGHDLYSSSKACSELLTASYRKSFFYDNSILIACARAGNVIGGGDWAKDRLIPDIFRGVQNNVSTEIRNPSAIRPWEHVLEPLSGYLLIGQKLLEGNLNAVGSWNLGPPVHQNMTVGMIVEMMQKEWPQIKFKVDVSQKDFLHEANLLKLDCTKANKELAWKPVWDSSKTIAVTTGWYRDYITSGSVNSMRNLTDYVNDAKLEKLIWCQ